MEMRNNAQFNDEEFGALRSIYKRIKGPITYPKFRQVLLSITGSCGEISETQFKVMFYIFDQDQDGFINELEFLMTIWTLLRSGSEELANFYKKVVQIEEFQKKNSQPAPNRKTSYPLTPGPSFSPMKCPKVPKAPEISDKANIQSPETTSRLQTSEKKSAVIKMIRAIPDKALLYRLWNIVSTQPNLTKAWATSLFPTGKLIAVTKSVADVQMKGLTKGQYQYNHPHKNRTDPNLDDGGGCDPNWDLLKRQERLNLYGNGSGIHAN